MGWTGVKRAYKYRFYPTARQRTELLRTFGCVRKVYNLALDARTRAWVTEQRRVNFAQTSALLTGWKKSEELSYLGEVSSVPLQQALRHLQGAFASFSISVPGILGSSPGRSRVGRRSTRSRLSRGVRAG